MMLPRLSEFGIRRGFVDTPDGQIHYYEAGRGFPLVLLHSTPNAQLFLHALPLLGEHVRAISMDSPGYGDSARPPRPYRTVAEFATRVVQLIDGLGLESADILGHMTGAPIAAEVAAAYPDRIRRLVLSEMVDWQANVFQKAHHIEEPFAEPKADGSHLLRIWSRYADMIGKVPIEEIQRRFYTVYQAEYAGPPEGGFVYGAAGWPAAAPSAIDDYACWDRVAAIRARTLVMCGNAGKLRSGGNPLEERAAFVRSIPAAVGAVLDGLDHTAPVVSPAKFCEPVLAFLR